MARGASSSLCLAAPDLFWLCEVTTAQACGASRGAHQRGTPGEGGTSPRLCTRIYRRPACTSSACQRQEGMEGIKGIRSKDSIGRAQFYESGHEQDVHG